MLSTLRFPAPRPTQTFDVHDPHRAFVEPDGTICHARGELMGRLSPDLVGRNVLDVVSSSPKLMDAWRRALMGEQVIGGFNLGETPEGEPQEWYVELTPIRGGGGLIGVELFALPSVPAEQQPKPAERITEAAGDDPEFGVESGDRFVKRWGRRGVFKISHWADSVYEEYERRDPGRVHIIRDFPPPAAPRLRLL